MTGANPGTILVRVVGVDPGPTPGVAVRSVVAGLAEVQSAVFQCDRESVHWLVAKLLGAAPVGARRVLAVERYVVGMRSANLRGAAASGVTRDMVGALTALGRDLPGVLVVQRSAGEVMPWASDRRLTAANLLAVTKGMPHARAASRHALFAAVHDARLPDPLAKVRAP